MTPLYKFLAVLCLWVAALPAMAQPVFPPASQNEVNAGLLHTKFVAPDTLRGFTGFLVGSNGFITSTNLKPFAATLTRDTTFDFIQFTNFTKLFTNWSSSISTNLEPNVSGTNGYIRVTNDSHYIVSFNVNYRNHTNIAVGRTNIFVVTTNSLAGGTNQTGIAATLAANALNNVVGNVSAQSLLYLPSNTFVNLGFLSTTAVPTNDISVEGARLTVMMVPNSLAGTFNVVGGGLSGLTTNGNQFGPSTTLTIKDGVTLTNINLGNLATNRPMVISKAGFATNAFKRYYIETNQPPEVISNIIASASYGDLIELGAGAFNWGFQSMRLPVGVHLRGQGNGATRVYGFGSLTTNGPVIIVQSSNVVEDLDIIRDRQTTPEITTAAIGFNHFRNDTSFVSDKAATNFLIRNVRCLEWTTDAIYFTHSNYFAGRVENCESYAVTDNLVVDGYGILPNRTNWVEFLNCKVRTVGVDGSDAVGIRMSSGSGLLHNMDVKVTGHNSKGIKASGTNTSFAYIHVVGGNYDIFGTNTAVKASTTTSWDPSDVVFFITGNPFAQEDIPGGSTTHVVNGSYTNLTVRGDLNVGDLAQMGRANISGLLTVGAGGSIIGEYPTEFPSVAIWTADGRLTNAAAGGAGEFMKPDGTSAVPPGGSASPGGGDMAIQFNQDGSTFAGTNEFFFDRTNKRVNIVTSGAGARPGIETVNTTLGWTSRLDHTSLLVSEILTLGAGGLTVAGNGQWTIAADGTLSDTSVGTRAILAKTIGSGNFTNRVYNIPGAGGVVTIYGTNRVWQGSFDTNTTFAIDTPSTGEYYTFIGLTNSATISFPGSWRNRSGSTLTTFPSYVNRGGFKFEVWVDGNGTNFAELVDREFTLLAGPRQSLSTNDTTGVITTLLDEALTNQLEITTVAGVGGANTNFTIQARNAARTVYIDAGTTNVNIVALMQTTATEIHRGTLILTNRTGTARLFSLGASTNNWISLQQFDGVSAPFTVTNSLAGRFDWEARGTNVQYSYKPMALPAAQ